MTLDYPHNTKTLDRITHICAGALRVSTAGREHYRPQSEAPGWCIDRVAREIGIVGYALGRLVFLWSTSRKAEP